MTANIVNGFFKKLIDIFFKSLSFSDKTLLSISAIEDKNKDLARILGPALFEYNINKVFKELKLPVNKKRYMPLRYNKLYIKTYDFLRELDYGTAKFNIVFEILMDIQKDLFNLREYIKLPGLKAESINASIDDLELRYKDELKNISLEILIKQYVKSEHISILTSENYNGLTSSIIILLTDIDIASNKLNNTISNSLSKTTVELIKLYKNYNDLESRVEIERQLNLILDFLKEQIEINALPGSKKYIDNKLGESKFYIDSVIQNNNWIE